jgi:hypothetical protein
MAPAPRRVIRTITVKNKCTSQHARETIENADVKRFLARFQKMLIEVSMQRQEHWIDPKFAAITTAVVAFAYASLLSIPILRQS